MNLKPVVVANSGRIMGGWGTWRDRCNFDGVANVGNSTELDRRSSSEYFQRNFLSKILKDQGD